MTRVLVAYATKTGATQEIGDELSQRGLRVGIRAWAGQVADALAAEAQG